MDSLVDIAEFQHHFHPDKPEHPESNTPVQRKHPCTHESGINHFVPNPFVLIKLQKCAYILHQLPLTLVSKMASV
ncbi:hypothetical protein D3C74_312150 [compost metagenome]